MKQFRTPFSFLNDLDISDEVIQKLSQTLQRTVTGSDEDLLTPMGKEYGAKEILSEWDRIYLANSGALDNVLRDLEESQRSKFGPRSIAKPWVDRRESVIEYFNKENLPSNELKTLIHSARKGDKSRLRPLELKSAIRYLKNDTNSGLPFYTRKSNVKADLIDQNYFKSLLDRKDPCVLFTRTQEGGKTRTVWGYPIADTLHEMKFYRPLLDYQIASGYREALKGPDAVDLAITNLMKYANQTGKSLLSIDFSSYDASVKSDLQYASFEYIKGLFQPQYSSDIDYIRDRFNTIGLITPEGVYNGEHGVPSGSTFTNEVDSIAQLLCAAGNHEFNTMMFQIQGDDGAYAVSDPDKLMESFTNNKLNVNYDKSYISNNYIIYLQNLYSFSYQKDEIIRGIYPVYRALNRLVHQERFDDFMEYGIQGRDYYAIRSLMILENCKNHPLFEQLVKFTLSKDKYGLLPSQQGISDYVKMVESKAGADEIANYRYGDEVTGIKTFTSYQLIKRLSGH